MPESFFGHHTIKGDDGSPYMHRYWIGRLRLHIFERGDLDPDPHDHPWGFITFPLTSYVEETVWSPLSTAARINPQGVNLHNPHKALHRGVVPRFRFTYRPAEYCHRVLGRWAGPRGNGLEVAKGKIITIVWRGKTSRKWGFLKHTGKRWCWEYWRDYLNGGKNAPCGEP